MRYSTPAGQSERSIRLAKRMRRMRHKYNETQMEFAARFNVYWQTYARWERWGPPNKVPQQDYVDKNLSKLANELSQRKVRANAAAE